MKRYLRLSISVPFEVPPEDSPHRADLTHAPRYEAHNLVSLRPNDARVALAPVKQCIYCGVKEFTPGSGKPLSDEHIVAEGLGARLVLPEASCEACANKTKVIETDVLKGVLWTPRRQLKIRGKKRKRDESGGFPIVARIGGADVEFKLPIEDHPTLFLAIILNPPGIVIDRPDTVSGIQSVMAIELNDINKAQDHGATAVMTPTMDTVRFCQMLAKIAHGFAVSRFSLRGFQPVLPEFILRPFGKDDTWEGHFKYIGGDPTDYAPSDDLHNLSWGIMKGDKNKKMYLTVAIRLFANLGGPVYFVVVGEPSSELQLSPLADQAN